MILSRAAGAKRAAFLHCAGDTLPQYLTTLPGYNAVVVGAKPEVMPGRMPVTEVLHGIRLRVHNVKDRTP